MTLGVDFLLDDDGDVAFDGRDFSMGVSVAQRANIRLKRIRGEWFLDTEAGVDYFGFVFKKDPSIPLLRSVFRDELMKTPGIGTLETFELALDTSTRALEIVWASDVDASEIVIDVGTPT